MWVARARAGDTAAAIMLRDRSYAIESRGVRSPFAVATRTPGSSAPTAPVTPLPPWETSRAPLSIYDGVPLNASLEFWQAVLAGVGVRRYVENTGSGTMLRPAEASSASTR